jgi:prepilin-type N-terminal cleavage/methylation domain-containing protein
MLKKAAYPPIKRMKADSEGQLGRWSGMRGSQQGFTLVEIMVVCIIIGVLVAMGIPNFIQLQDRAREATVKANMHTLQLAFEDFAVHTLGRYPEDAASVTPSGQTVEDLCPGGAYPENPWTRAATVVAWDADPGVSGQMGINPAATTSYTIKGYGKNFLLLLVLTSGG